MTTKLSDHQSNDFVKLLCIGDSKSGKTGSLVSLVKAGYKLRIIDTDNLLDVLKYFIQHECPEKIDNVLSIPIRDKFTRNALERTVKGTPKAWALADRMCDHWKDDDIDLGPVAEWGPDCILVIDSLSRLCDAAFEYHESIIPRGRGGDYDRRAVYGNAQRAVGKLLLSITSDSVHTNVIVIAHVVYKEQPDGTTKGFPQGVGDKLSPMIPQFFPSVLLYTKKGHERVIQTNSSSLVDLSNPKPFAMQPTYPISTGLADFFAVLRPPPKPFALSYGGRMITPEVKLPETSSTPDDKLMNIKPSSLTLRRI